VIVYFAQKLVSYRFRRLSNNFKGIVDEGIYLWELLTEQGRDISTCPKLSYLIDVAHSAYATSAHYGGYDIGLTYIPSENDYIFLRASIRELVKLQRWKNSRAIDKLLISARIEVGRQ
jgi:hypothetical protein